MERDAPNHKPDNSRPETRQSDPDDAPTPSAALGPTFHADFTTDELPDDKLKDLHAIWLEKCHGGRLPGRADFDPTQLPPKLLPWMTIFDVEGERLHIRLVGTGIVEALGKDTTGQYLDELPNTDVLHARARWAVENAKPFFVTDMTMVWDEDRWGRYSVLCAPLADDGTNVDKLLYLMSFEG
jgi:hypothetical protein